MASSPATPLPERHRLDLWLWHARCVRSRTSAAELVRAGRVRVNGSRVTAPAHAVRLDDVVTVALDGRVRILRVIGFIARRGDAKAAATTYLEISPDDLPGSHAP
ncbi:S4 domain-containing protein [Ancylobacter sp. MQZ15Z-1]|uniref:S4 domain-containing protein n=1 Tax=Ancylobacter mangrovi TaxID=2972472 RepID=A0A9X2PDN9_9HYPH|nr:S4 domain-containing protein [Ancylobacter mangrovi]MCS0496814.1 S4 domain-containing protein [Ancylobacter mangrovi]